MDLMRQVKRECVCAEQGKCTLPTPSASTHHQLTFPAALPGASATSLFLSLPTEKALSCTVEKAFYRAVGVACVPSELCMNRMKY